MTNIHAGNIGLGKETIIQLAQHKPARIYLGARNASKAQDAIASIQETLPSPADIRHVPLDLASFKSIRAAAAQFTAECDRLDILVLNAGTMANPPTKTDDGYEVQFGTNHMGHFLLTKLLLPTLQKTVTAGPGAGADNDVRVVVLSSVGHMTTPSFEVMTSTEALLGVDTWTRYGASKAANILFAAELARRYPEILSVSVHPGAVASNLYEHVKASGVVSRLGVAAVSLTLRSVQSGALNQLWAAGADRKQLVNGAYYVPVGNYSKSRVDGDPELARKLWEWTDEQVSATGS